MKDPPAWGFVALFAILAGMMTYVARHAERVLIARRAFMQGDDRDPYTRRVTRGFAVLTTLMLLGPGWHTGEPLTALTMAGPVAGFFSLVELARYRRWPPFTATRIIGAAVAVAAFAWPGMGDTLFRVFVAVLGLALALFPRALRGFESEVTPGEILQTRIVATCAAVLTGTGALVLAARTVWYR